MDDERETSQADAPPSDSMQGEDQTLTHGDTACPDCLGTGSREGMDCITCDGTGVAPEESGDAGSEGERVSKPGDGLVTEEGVNEPGTQAERDA